MSLSSLSQILFFLFSRSNEQEKRRVHQRAPRVNCDVRCCNFPGVFTLLSATVAPRGRRVVFFSREGEKTHSSIPLSPSLVSQGCTSQRRLAPLSRRGESPHNARWPTRTRRPAASLSTEAADEEVRGRNQMLPVETTPTTTPIRRLRRSPASAPSPPGSPRCGSRRSMRSNAWSTEPGRTSCSRG